MLWTVKTGMGYTITDGQDSALIQVSMGFADSE
jgi:hypothetical protein